MTTRFFCRLALTCAALFLAAGLAAPVVLQAQSNDGLQECIDDCIDTYEDDMTVCQDDLVVCLDAVAQQIQDCQDQAGGDPIQEALCVRSGRIQRANCERDFRRCENFAVTYLYNCYRDCVNSPSAP